MSRLRTFYSSTLGKKAVVAVTGVMLYGFVLMHMIGNLKTFTGSDPEGVPHIDIYAHFLRTMGEPVIPPGFILWGARISLLVAVVLHLVTVAQLTMQNLAARPVQYHRFVRMQSTFAARSMLATGLMLLVFIVLHLLHFTTGTIDITPIVPATVYANLYYAFSKWFIAFVYVFAMGLLGLHVYHGAWSLFQTLGLDNPDRNRGFRHMAAAAALILVLGFCAVPVMFYFKLMPPPPPTPAQDQPLENVTTPLTETAGEH